MAQIGGGGQQGTVSVVHAREKRPIYSPGAELPRAKLATLV